MTTPKLKNYQGPALLSYGYKPFFFFGSLYSGFSVVLWLPLFYGELELASEFAAVDWHIHEMFFGFLAAVITGFLFTAVPNWTGRMPVRGWPLFILVLIWLAGRIAVTFSTHIGWFTAMSIDLLFIASILGVLANEIISGKNWRNLTVLYPLILLLFANAGFHLEAHYSDISDVSRRLAMAAVILLIMIIGGRIIPSFTRNWLVRENPGRLPITFSRFDLLSIAFSAVALAVWVIFGTGDLPAVLMAIAAVLQVIRLFRWAGDRTLREPLVTVLHVSYFFIPIGFSLIAFNSFAPEFVSPLVGIHALAIGAVGGMTLSVMLRATLGHSGQVITTGKMAKAIFASVFLAAFCRIIAEFDENNIDLWLNLSAATWFFAFVGFGLSFAPLFLKQKPGS
ncbi:MAG: NnrS family protein [Sneathiella sp.]|uniref:NnrS family protein n=1 Tax=Sneathiella sp. TaxID=1964365 RepID=UPI003001E033